MFKKYVTAMVQNIRENKNKDDIFLLGLKNIGFIEPELEMFDRIYTQAHLILDAIGFPDDNTDKNPDSFCRDYVIDMIIDEQFFHDNHVPIDTIYDALLVELKRLENVK